MLSCDSKMHILDKSIQAGQKHSGTNFPRSYNRKDQHRNAVARIFCNHPWNSWLKLMLLAL
jgi:hypothetical protein